MRIYLTTMTPSISIINVFRTEPIIEPKKLPIHDSLVGLVVKPGSKSVTS